jgi:hypothetical protein
VELGEPFDLLDVDEMRRVIGSPLFRGGLYTPCTVMQQPTGCAHGMARVLAHQACRCFPRPASLPSRSAPAVGPSSRRWSSRGRVDPHGDERAPRILQLRARPAHPQIAGLPNRHVWSGHLCLSHNGAPGAREIENGVYASCVQNGLGSTRGTLTGIAAAEQSLGQTSEVSDLFLNGVSPSHLPPEPLATLGARGDPLQGVAGWFPAGEKDRRGGRSGSAALSRRRPLPRGSRRSGRGRGSGGRRGCRRAGRGSRPGARRCGRPARCGRCARPWPPGRRGRR